jgi:hypothetical protein
LLDPLGQDTRFFVSMREGLRGLLRRERPVAERWTAVKEATARDILLQGWNPTRGAFTQSYGSDLLDASLLLLPRCQFLPVEDERVPSTIELISKELTGGGLVYLVPALASFLCLVGRALPSLGATVLTGRTGIP